MATIRYSYELAYRGVPGAGLQPALPVRLFFGRKTAQALGVLDTGSSVTAFNSEVADFLGIPDITVGEALVARTQAGIVELYLFDLELEVMLSPSNFHRFPAQVGFHPAPRARNILGRNVLFAHYSIGFRERHSMMYLEPED